MLKLNGKSKDLEAYCIKNNMRCERVDHYTLLVEINGRYLPFFTLNGPSCNEPTRRIIEYKNLTLACLAKRGLSVSPWTLFDKANPKSLFKFAEDKYPIVLKPINGRKGYGLIFGIEGERDLVWALKVFRSESGWGLAEKYFEGDDYRAFVVMDRVVAFSKRDAANVAGDGIHTVKELIDIKNQYRLSMGEYYSSRLIPTDIDRLERLADQNIGLEYIPDAGEKIYLKYARNVSQGGDSIDCTPSLSRNLAQVLVEARRSIPTLNYTAIDIMINGDIAGEFDYVINELNFQFANLAMNHTYGKNVDMIEPIIQFYRENYG